MTQYCAGFIQSSMSGDWLRKFLASVSVLSMPIQNRVYFMQAHIPQQPASRAPLSDLEWSRSSMPGDWQKRLMNTLKNFFPLELLVQSVILYIRVKHKPKIFLLANLIKIKIIIIIMLSSCIIKLGILNNTVERYLILVMMCLHQLLNLNPLNIFWALKCMFVLVLSFEHLSRKCTEDISWHRDLEFQQK